MTGNLAAWRAQGIERLAAGPPYVDGYRVAVGAGRPVSLALAEADCAFLAWDTDWLGREAGESVVKLYSSNRTNFGLAPGGEVATAEVTLGSYLSTLGSAAVDAAAAAGRHEYLRQVDVDGLALRSADPAARSQAGWLTEDRAPLRRNLWVGARGIRTNLHFDSVANVYVQIQGRKKVWLAPPQDLERVYPFPADSRAYQTSQVDWQAIDESRFPAAHEASIRSITLEPGDALHIPAFWWHELESADEVSVSVNIWWKPPLLRCLVPGLLHRIVNMHAGYGVFAVDKMLRDGFELDGPDWAETAVSRLVAEDEPLFALLLLEAALAQRLRTLAARPGGASNGAEPGARPRTTVPQFSALIALAVERQVLADADAALLGAVVSAADRARGVVLSGEKQSPEDERAAAEALDTGLGLLARLVPRAAAAD